MAPRRAVGSGGNRRQGLEGKGPTPRASQRPGHPAARKAAAKKRTEHARPQQRADEDVVVGRNPVVEALRTGVPAKGLLVAPGLPRDDRVAEALRRAAELRIPVREAIKSELDRLSGGAAHQGLALLALPFSYEHPDDVLRTAGAAADPALIVALDGVTDPHNLGAVIRSVAAFGGHGVVVPERRAAGVTASAWKASAGAAARVPVARATNLARTLRSYADAGLLVVGLTGEAVVSIDELVAATEPLCLVVGSEGAGLGRLVSAACQLRVRIPISAATESLNASVATGVALAEIARRRRANTDELGHTGR